MRILTTLVATLLFCLNVPAADKAHTKAELLLSAEAARPGDTVMAAVRLRSEPKWHTYWKNPGESGMATDIKWQLPVGVKAGDIRWPAPERLEAEGLTTFILHDEVMLLIPLQLAADLKPGPLELKAKVSWLECEQLCIPGDATVSATLNIANEARPSSSAALIVAAEKQLPSTEWTFGSPGSWEAESTNNTRNLLIAWNTKGAGADYDFIPYASDDFETGLKVERLRSADQPLRVTLRTQLKKSSANWPDKIGGLIVEKSGGRRTAYEVFLTPNSAAAAPGPAMPSAKPAKPFPAPGVLLAQLLAALVGGMLLNLMPCVLPILSLKVLTLVRQGGQEASVARRHSLFYLLGVVVSFWAVAALVIAGKLTSYGGQFQDVRFVVLITAMMTLIALNLFGVFEFTLPGGAINSASELASREGNSGAFFNGMLAVVLGASCVGPVMASAVGWAFTQSAAVILLIFTSLGIGLALPFVLLTFVPALRKFFPKPGAWMEKFKIALGFPMLGMAVWSFSIVIVHHGRRGALWLGVFLVALGLAAWVYGEFIQRGSKRRGLAWLVVLAAIGGGYGYALEYQLDWRHPAPLAVLQPSGTNAKADEIPWQPWSAEAVAQARAAGRPVLVDFTADWCLICQGNKASSIEIKSVREKLKAINAVTLIGDYTLKQPEITAELNRFDRAGVPLVLVYPKDASKPPQVLPAVLTPSIMLEALDAAAK